MDLLTLGKTPISDDKPTGADAKYEPEYEALQAEIDLLNSLTAGRRPDWKKVSETATAILETKSKDLLAAGYLGVALVYEDKAAGLAAGIRIYADLLETFWQDLFPPKKRMRGRLAAANWWSEKMVLALQQTEIPPVPEADLEGIKSDFERIRTALTEYFGSDVSTRELGELVGGLPVIAEKKPEPEPDPAASQDAAPAEKAAPAAPKPSAPQAPAPADTEIASEKDAYRVIQAGMKTLRQAAAYLCEQHPTDPTGYRMTRYAAWGDVAALPPATDGKTRIPAPPAQVVKILSDLNESGNWSGLLQSAEKNLGQYIFWLDLCCYSANALAAQGGPYEKARDAVCAETAAFLQRVPGLASLMFADGTPFANAQTQQWLREISAGQGPALDSGAGAAAAGAGGEADAKMQDAVSEARTLAGQKKVGEALALLQTHMAAAPSKREQMLWRLALAKIILNAQKGDAALPHCEKMLAELDDHRLEDWEPMLALDMLRTIWAALNRHGDKEVRAGARQILNRIALLDAAEALRLEK